jgi:hypothetical protein
MRQLKVKSLDEQFNEYVDCVYECFDECPDRPDALFRAYTLLSNALDISLSTVDVLVWGIKNNGGIYDTHDVAMKVSISEWEVHRAVNELSRLSYMEIFMGDHWELRVKTSNVVLEKFKWHFEAIRNSEKDY